MFISKKRQGGENLAEEMKLPEEGPTREEMQDIVDRYYDAMEELDRILEEFKKIQDLYQKAAERSMEVQVEAE